MKNRLAMALFLSTLMVLAGNAPAGDQKADSPRDKAASKPDSVRWPYRIVIVPDTQRYTVDRVYKSDPGKKGDTRKGLPTAKRAAIFEQMMQWVADNAKTENIKLLLHVGDIVENKGNKAQHKIIEKGIARLDGNVPYVLAIGNHDSARVASEFFPVSRNPLNVKMAGDVRVKGVISDLYSKITINNQKYLVLTLGYIGRKVNPKGFAPRLEWANAVIKKHPDHKVLFLTHALLGDSSTQGGKPSFTGSGRYLFDNFLAKHANMYMTFCGHVYDRSGDGVATGYRRDLGEAKNAIHSTLFNSQWIRATGGDGWLRIVEFHKDGSVVHKTYSPYLNKWNKGPGFEFKIPARRKVK